jgi:K+-transporting ATPase KdpF subunit
VLSFLDAIDLKRRFQQEAAIHGHCVFDPSPVVFRGSVGIREIVRTLDGRPGMTVLYVIAGVIALALLIYLFAALLKPEAFE